MKSTHNGKVPDVCDIALSVIIPIFNEIENIQLLCSELTQVLDTLGKKYEILTIDDGSTDGSYQMLQKMKQKYPALRIIKFKENRGMSAAFAAGFLQARGEYVITLDGDLQNDPRDIPSLLQYASSFDAVIGWRYQRKDTVWKKLQSLIANKVRRLVLRDNIKDTGCSLKIMKRTDLLKLPVFPGYHRFLPILLQADGRTIKQVKVNHRPRLKGQSKYGMMNRIFNSFSNMLMVRRIIQAKDKRRKYSV